jgi:branched-chain amino acid transport system permease protein|tara:strand:- start:5209 stop:6126 length:918 start_codon:yes stop_codon:yes gene_type:complete
MAVLEGAIVYSNLLVLLGIGLIITYITTGVPNFAQGSMAIFGSYISLTLWLTYGINPYFSLPISFLFGGTLGILIYLIFLKPLIRKEAKVVTLMIATLAIDIIFLGILGSYAETLRTIIKKSTKKFIFTPLDFDFLQFDGILIVSSLIIVTIFSTLFYLLHKTKFGIAMRASMENPSLAEIMGVNVEYTRIFSWFLSGSLAALAGSLLPFRQEIVPLTGTVIIVSIFAASIVGGLGSIYGALAGGYIIGISESLITFYLSKFFGPGILVYGKVISLTILVTTLILAPTGIVGLKIWRNKRWPWIT